MPITQFSNLQQMPLQGIYPQLNQNPQMNAQNI